MVNKKKRASKRVLAQVNFEEMDHRLSCGWHVELEESGQRKRYLRLIKSSKDQILSGKQISNS